VWVAGCSSAGAVVGEDAGHGSTAKDAGHIVTDKDAGPGSDSGEADATEADVVQRATTCPSYKSVVDRAQCTPAYLGMACVGMLDTCGKTILESCTCTSQAPPNGLQQWDCPASSCPSPGFGTDAGSDGGAASVTDGGAG
jgi:hypothetical protein